MYKTDTKNEAKMLRPITKWEAIYGSWIPEIGLNIVKTMQQNKMFTFVIKQYVCIILLMIEQDIYLL